MDKVRKLLGKFTSMLPMINLVVGVTLIVSLIFIYNKPDNRYALLIACIAGGIINILQALKFMKQPKKMVAGMPYLMLGIIIIIMGIILVNLGKQ